MKDIRALNLEERRVIDVSAVSTHQYMLGPERLKRLETHLNEMQALNYWHPYYQAWEPFVTAYLMSGANPQMASRWLIPLQEKIPILGPADTSRSAMYGEVANITRTHSTEIFKGVEWSAIEEFASWVQFFIEHEKDIYKSLFNVVNWNEQLDCYVQLGSSGQWDKLVMAIYMYRHCMLEDNPTTGAVKQEIQRQLIKFAEDFDRAFNTVGTFVDSIDGVYQWYSGKVMTLIHNTWLSSLDLTTGRHVIGPADVYAMDIWLSEQLTKYLNALPCVATVQPDSQFVFNALVGLIFNEFNLENSNNVWAYCIPRQYIKTMVTNMLNFYWDVRQNRLTSYMIDRVSARWAGHRDDDAISPEEYKQDLIARGFPMEGLDA